MADSALAARRHDAGAKPVEVADLARLSSTLRYAAGLDDTTRERLAEADGLTSQIDSLSLQGDFATAFKDARQQLSTREAILGSSHLEVAESMLRLGELATARGQIPENTGWCERALAIRRRALGPDHPDVIRAEITLLNARRKVAGGYAVREPLRRVVERARVILGPDAPEVGDALSGLANAHRSLEEFERAKPLLREALAIHRRTLGERSVQVAADRMDLGLVLLRTKDWRGAERELRRSLETRQAVLGAHDPNRFVALSLLGQSLQAQGRYAEAERLHRESAGISERARARLDLGVGRIFSRLVQYEDLSAILLVTGREAEALPTLERFRGRLLGELLGIPGETARGDTTTSVPTPSTVERIQGALPERAALLGWLDVTPGMNEPHSAWGFVVRRSGPVRWIRLRTTDEELGTQAANRMDRFLTELGRAAAWPVRVDSTSEASAEGRAAWTERIAPLMPFLDGIDELVVVGSGGFRCPIEAMVDSSGVYLDRRFAVSYAPSGTSFAWLRERARRAPPPRHRRALLVGDPPFSGPQLIAMQSERAHGGLTPFDHVPERVSLPEGRVMRAAGSGDPGALARLPRLLGTRWEVEQLSRLMPGALVLVGPRASKHELYELARTGEMRRFDTIHFASHVLVTGATSSLGSLVLAQAANSGDGGVSPVTDGVLSTDEVLNRLHLDADLVTLSGCQSAPMSIVYGEGPTGLTHAFIAAGARSLVASLWRTDDRAAALLMRRFYENLNGSYDEDRGRGPRVAMRKVDALREARWWLRSYRDAAGARPYRHPGYWSGFVLFGDPG
ncbi:MAG TPA: CHAT domain-containing protein [Candidatus Eisenbacteria bacterium]